MHGVETNMKSPKNPNDIIAMQLNGCLQEAHDAYVHYFHENHIDYRLLSMFAICCVDIGKHEKAEKLFEAIIDNAPQITEAYIHLAELLVATNRVEQAMELLCRDPIKQLEDENIELTKCDLLCRLNRHADAAKLLRAICSKAPNNISATIKLVEIEVILGNLSNARKIIDKAVFEKPDDFKVRELQAVIFAAEEKWDSALVSITPVVNALPRNIAARLIKCKALQESGQKEKHLEEAQILADIDPENPEILACLMNAQKALNQHPNSIYTASKLLGISPNHPEALSVLAGGYFGTCQYEKAVSTLDKFLKLIPNDANTISSKGVCLERLFRLDEAIEQFDTALELEPSNTLIKFNKSLCLLAKGSFHEGFELYENRLEGDRLSLSNYIGGEPEWKGFQSLQGRHILVHPEQGFGDTIMAARFVKQLNDDGAQITLAVPKSLESVMRTLDVKCDVVTVGDDVESIDFHSSLMSLAHHTSERWDSLPAESRYLYVPQIEKQRWSKELAGRKAFRVGVVCSGNPDHKNDVNRSLNMVQMMESLPVGPEYHILQKDLRPTDWIAVNNYADVYEHSEHIETFADTAALCESMDLIVSVDTSVAHLAGALGSRLIVLVPLCGDWRWGVHQTRSDWYPNAMILRQLELGDWTHPFQKLNLIIANEIARRSD